jgi:hypothetical protein
MIYAFVHGERAPQLANAMVSFRNDVVHKGKFPSRDETVAYGQATFDLAHIVIGRLKAEAYASALHTVVGFRLRDGHVSARKENARASTYAMQTPLCLTSANSAASVDEAIAALIARPPVKQLADLAAVIRQLVSQGVAHSARTDQ